MTTTAVRPGYTSVGEARICIGTHGWSDPSMDRFFSRGQTGLGRLAAYAQIFGGVEVNGTFYDHSILEKAGEWRRVVPEEFVFAVKAPAVLTHERMLSDPEPELGEFLRLASQLEGNLGPVLLQLPPSFGSLDIQSLVGFVRRLPVDEMRFCVEVRNPRTWSPQLVDMLSRWRVGVVTNNLLCRPGELVESEGFVYMRLMGNRTGFPKREVDGETFVRETAAWADGIKALASKESSPDVYTFVDHAYYGSGVRPASYLSGLLGRPLQLPGFPGMSIW